MANLIDTSYFINEISLPVDQVSAELTSYITKYEKEILIKCLGYDLYKAFITGLSSGTIAQKWLNLRDGLDYIDNGITYNWPGLINTSKESLIAYYVFYKYLAGTNSFNSALGQKVVNSENSGNISPVNKQVDAFNRCSSLVDMLGTYINYANGVDSSTYPNYDPEVIGIANIFNL